MRRTHDDIEDELLMLMCQDGEQEALAVLVSRWQPRLRTFAWRLTGAHDAAQDVVQESWMAIVRGLNGLDDPASFRTWAYRIVRNKAADWIRRRGTQWDVQAKLADRPARFDADGGDGVIDKDDSRRLRRAMEGLSIEQRAILSLHYLDGMSLKEIGETLGIPEGTVKSRLFHARKQLRGVLERVGP